MPIYAWNFRKWMHRLTLCLGGQHLKLSSFSEMQNALGVKLRPVKTFVLN